MQGNSCRKVEKKLKSEINNIHLEKNKTKKNKRNNSNSSSRDYCYFNHPSYNKYKCIVWRKWTNQESSRSKTTSIKCSSHGRGRNE